MRKQDLLVRTLLLLLIGGAFAAVLVLDQTRGNDRPRVEPVAAAESVRPDDPNRTAMGTPTRTPRPDRTATDGAEPGVIATPPPDVEAIACRKVEQTVEIRVLDFNTHRSYGGIGTVAAEIAAVDPDIVLLQEIDRFKAGTGNIDQAAYFADALGMDHAFGANVTSGNGEYGVAVLSRFEILDSQNHLLPNGPGGEQRGLLGVDVEIGGQQVRIYNTHLQNKLSGLREAQARAVAAIMADDDLPIILGGDMNATVNTPTLAPLTAQLVDAWTVGSGPEGTGPNGSRIDFLLASPTITPQGAQVLRSAISDHARLYSDFEVPTSTDCPTQLRREQARKRD